MSLSDMSIGHHFVDNFCLPRGHFISNDAGVSSYCVKIRVAANIVKLLNFEPFKMADERTLTRPCILQRFARLLSYSLTRDLINWGKGSIRILPAFFCLLTFRTVLSLSLYFLTFTSENGRTHHVPAESPSHYGCTKLYGRGRCVWCEKKMG